MWAQTYGRSDLYACLHAAEGSAETTEERRFVSQVLSRARQAGASLEDPEQRAKVSALDSRSSALAFEIEQNINEDDTKVHFTEEELSGCSEDFINSLPKASEGELGRLVSVKAPTAVPIMKRATCGETRRKMLEATQSRCMSKNAPLLEKLLKARHEAATQMGFKHHAERMLSCKMASTIVNAEAFCSDMLERIMPLRNAEIKRLRARKQTDCSLKRKRDVEEAYSVKEKLELHPWDTAFYSDLLKREELSFDDERVKEFFPLESTIERMLNIYSEFLGLIFERNDLLPRWHDEVHAFEVKSSGGEVVGHLFLDQFPREGKFGHQMIVPLSPSFVDSCTGQRCVPACVNISNLPRAEGGKPALLRFGEMQTLFHELGHVMHCLCTTTRFSLLSWAWPMVPWPGGVEQDFLEVPSMALEKLACERALLDRVAMHYSQDPEAPKLGSDVADKVKALEKWMVGMGQSRYFAMALFDLLAHSQEPPYSFCGEDDLSVDQFFARILEKHTDLKQLPGMHPCASWYHLVIGYDAGYYGYGWSDVYAADLFSAMVSAPEGILSPANGQRFREEILGPCATRAGGDMLRAFLGREPSADAWCERNGIPSKAGAAKL